MPTKAKQIPFDRKAEAAVIGSMVLGPSCIPVVTEIVQAQDFYDEQIRCLFEVIYKLWQDNRENIDLDSGVDAVLIGNELNKLGQSGDQIFEVLKHILATTPSAANAQYYADIVRTKNLERKMVISVDKLVGTIHDQSLDFKEKQAVFEQAALSLDLDSKSERPVVLAEGIVQVLSKELDQDSEGLVFYTGFRKLDSKLGGFRPGDFVILAGRPSIGKSAFLLDMALGIAKDHHCVAIFSMEMSPDALIQRILCNVGQVNLHQYRNKLLALEEWPYVYEAGEKLKQYNIIIDGSSMLTPAALAAKIFRLKAQRKVECVFVDYLQLMYLPERKAREGRQQEITRICSELKALAKKADIALVVLSQLNRQVEYRTDHRPRLSDLRESGSIEQDADVVLFLHRGAYYRKKEDPEAREDGEAICIVAKNRQGPTGDVELVWLPEFVKFANLMEDKELSNEDN